MFLIEVSKQIYLLEYSPQGPGIYQLVLISFTKETS
jgi:hypothetical protein